MLTPDDLKYHWQTLHSIDAAAINEAIDEVHHVSQILAATAKSFLDPKEDDSHTNFEWLELQDIMITRWINGNPRFAVALDPIKLKISLIDEKMHHMATFSVHQKTRPDIFVWLSNKLQNIGLDTNRLSFSMHYEIPPHPSDDGSSYTLPPLPVITEYTKQITNGAWLIKYFTEQYGSSSQERIWPHHFDLGALIQLKNPTQSIGLGWAKSDNSNPSPYYYIRPYGFGDPEGKHPSLAAGGKWQSHEWYGAKLPLDSLLTHDSAEMQAENALQFMQTVISHLVQLADQ